MTGRGEKLQQLHCYHPFSDSLDIYLTQNHYENYSPKMVPIAKIWGSGSWTKSNAVLKPLYKFGGFIGWSDWVVVLTHWGRVTHICVGKLTIICSDNGLSPERRQAIIWTNAGILLIGPLGTNFSEISIEIQTFSLKKIRLKMSSAKLRNVVHFVSASMC